MQKIDNISIKYRRRLWSYSLLPGSDRTVLEVMPDKDCWDFQFPLPIKYILQALPSWKTSNINRFRSFLSSHYDAAVFVPSCSSFLWKPASRSRLMTVLSLSAAPQLLCYGSFNIMIPQRGSYIHSRQLLSVPVWAGTLSHRRRTAHLYCEGQYSCSR